MARSIATNTRVDRADLIEFLRPRHRVVLMTTRADEEIQDVIEDLLNGDDEIEVDVADDEDDADDVEEDFDAVIISSSVAAAAVSL